MYQLPSNQVALIIKTIKILYNFYKERPRFWLPLAYVNGDVRVLRTSATYFLHRKEVTLYMASELDYYSNCMSQRKGFLWCVQSVFCARV